MRFVDDTSAEVDAIVHATGFEPPTDFLPEHARPAPRSLYQGIAHTEAPNLLFVGMMEAHRALLPIADDQAAWVADVLSDRIALPGDDERRSAAARFAERRLRDFGDRREYMVDHAKYRAMLRRDRSRRGNGRRG